MKKLTMIALVSAATSMMYAGTSYAGCIFYVGYNYTGSQLSLGWGQSSAKLWSVGMDKKISSVKLNTAMAYLYDKSDYQGTRWMKSTSGNLYSGYGDNQASSVQCYYVPPGQYPPPLPRY